MKLTVLFDISSGLYSVDLVNESLYEWNIKLMR